MTESRVRYSSWHHCFQWHVADSNNSTCSHCGFAGACFTGETCWDEAYAFTRAPRCTCTHVNLCAWTLCIFLHFLWHQQTAFCRTPHRSRDKSVHFSSQLVHSSLLSSPSLPPRCRELWEPLGWDEMWSDSWLLQERRGSSEDHTAQRKREASPSSKQLCCLTLQFVCGCSCCFFFIKAWFAPVLLAFLCWSCLKVPAYLFPCLQNKPLVKRSSINVCNITGCSFVICHICKGKTHSCVSLLVQHGVAFIKL